MLSDLRYAVRSLRKNPGFTLVAVITLALGVGANASVFGLIDTLLFRPPAMVRDPDTVKRIYFRDPARDHTWSGISFPVFRDLSEHAHLVSSIAAFFRQQTTVGIDANAYPAAISLVTHEFFPLLGVQPAVGRFFDAAEDRPGVAGVALVSYGFWQRRLGGDRNVLGSILRAGSEAYTVIGVTPRGFTGVNIESVDVWLPLRRANAMVFGQDVLESRTSSWLSTIARLPQGMAPSVAEQQLTQVFRTVSRGAPTIGFDSTSSVILGPIQLARGPFRSLDEVIAGWLAIVASLVLLIVCANVANLLLAQAARRRHELAVRLALGAGRRRVLRQVLLQTLILAILAGLAALLVEAWTGPVVQAMLLKDLPADRSALDVRVFAFTAGVALVAGGLAGILPALQASRPDVVAALKSETRGPQPRARTRAALLVAQVAITLVLLAGAGLFIRSVQHARADLGFAPNRVIVGTMDGLQQSGRPAAEINGLFLSMLQRLRLVAGVEGVAASVGRLGQSFGASVSVSGHDSLPQLKSGGPYVYAVTPGFFAVMGTPILRGRGLTAADDAGAVRVAVINQTMAHAIWPGQDPLGQCLLTEDKECYTIVGIAGDMRRERAGEDPQMLFYVPLSVPFGWHGLSITALYVRPARDIARFIPLVQREMRSVAPDLPYPTVMTLEDMISPSFRPWRLGVAVFSLSGLLALVVAAVGLYGVLTYTVAQRAHELGVRIALGAEERDLLRLVVGQGVRVTALGIAIGMAGALAMGRVLSSLLYEVSPLEPRVLGSVAAILLAVAALASYLPARRAARVDPIVTLRYE